MLERPFKDNFATFKKYIAFDKAINTWEFLLQMHADMYAIYKYTVTFYVSLLILAQAQGRA